MDGEQVAFKIRNDLLKKSVGKQVMKIILFGSHAKRTSRTDSDIDLLVVTSNGEGVREAVREVLYDIILDIGAPVEDLICSVEEITWVDNYFIYNVLESGKEVYTVDKETLTREAIRGMLNLSKEYMISANHSKDGQHWRIAVDAAYNAAELIAKALLMERMEDLPSSHGGIVGKFGELYVKSGEVDRSLGSNLHRALQMRNWARYRWDKEIREQDFSFLRELVDRLDKVAESRERMGSSLYI